MRVLVCGGRTFTDYDTIEHELTLLAFDFGIDCLIHGGAPGADSLAAVWAKKTGVETHSYPADWKTYGRAAGPIRNQQMLDLEKPDLILAFPGGRGTADMITRAEGQGFKVKRVTTLCKCPPNQE